MTAADWMDDAACREVDSALFFVDGKGNHGDQERQAKRVCHPCPVKAECLALALSFTDITADGVWAGTTPEERRHMPRPPRAHAMANHGTEARYKSHWRRGEDCQPCKDAHALRVSMQRDSA